MRRPFINPCDNLARRLLVSQNRSITTIPILNNNLHAVGKTLIIATHDLEMLSYLADRALIFSEEHTLAAECPARDIFADLDLLHRVNLIHEHLHRHGSLIHSHPHYHSGDHDHTHE